MDLWGSGRGQEFDQSVNELFSRSMRIQREEFRGSTQVIQFPGTQFRMISFFSFLLAFSGKAVIAHDVFLCLVKLSGTVVEKLMNLFYNMVITVMLSHALTHGMDIPESFAGAFLKDSFSVCLGHE